VETAGSWRARLRRPVVRDSLAVGVATGLYGVSFGAVSVASGLSVLQTCALSLLVFTGASQFALVGVLASGGAAAAAAATAVLLGSRNTLYGLRLATRLGVRGRRRALAAHLVIDESTAMATAQRDDAEGRTGFWVTGGSVFVLWNAMTALGALAGNALGDPRTYGLDAAVGAAFLGLLWPRLAERGMVPVAVAAVVLALVLVPVSPAGAPVLAVGIVALALGVGAPLPRATRGAGPPPGDTR
jgi:predicted branched-subunit amino acid permease